MKTEMRRKDREVNDFNETLCFLSSQNSLRLALCSDGFPYVVPLSYGFEAANNSVSFYIHSAQKGKKVDILSKNSNVCVEIDKHNGFLQLEDGISVAYESFIAFGKAYLCDEKEKLKGLDLLMKNCGFGGFPDGKCNLTKITNVYKIEVEAFSHKKRI